MAFVSLVFTDWQIPNDRLVDDATSAQQQGKANMGCVNFGFIATTQESYAGNTCGRLEAFVNLAGAFHASEAYSWPVQDTVIVIFTAVFNADHNICFFLKRATSFAFCAFLITYTLLFVNDPWICVVVARKETAREKQLKEEEKILESVAEKTGELCENAP